MRQAKSSVSPAETTLITGRQLAKKRPDLLQPKQDHGGVGRMDSARARTCADAGLDPGLEGPVYAQIAMGPTGAAMDKPITVPEADADSSTMGELLAAARGFVVRGKLSGRSEA